MENAVISRKCADMLSMLDPLVDEVVSFNDGGCVVFLVGEVAAFISPDGGIDYISYWDKSFRYRMSLKWAAFLGTLRAIRL